MLALSPRGLREDKSKPGKVVDNRRLELRLATGAVQVLNAQQQAPAEFGGEALVHERGIRVAEVERSVRRGCEAQDRGHENVIDHGG